MLANCTTQDCAGTWLLFNVKRSVPLVSHDLHCADLTLFCIDISTLFFSIMLLFSFLHLVARQIDWVSLLIRLISILIPMFIFALHFIWRLICNILNLLGRSWMAKCVTALFLVNNRQHRPVCTKTISSWARTVPLLLKHMSLGSLCSAVALGSLGGWCFPCVHPACGWLGQSFYTG